MAKCVVHGTELVIDEALSAYQTSKTTKEQAEADGIPIPVTYTVLAKIPYHPLKRHHFKGKNSLFPLPLSSRNVALCQYTIPHGCSGGEGNFFQENGFECEEEVGSDVSFRAPLRT